MVGSMYLPSVTELFLGPSTHAFKSGKGYADAASGGSGPFVDIEQIPLEAG
jgi:hypothetical protein